MICPSESISVCPAGYWLALTVMLPPTAKVVVVFLSMPPWNVLFTIKHSWSALYVECFELQEIININQLMQD
jgi:hypothetical protein